MKHNANLVIRLPADLRDTVNQLAVSHSCSVAEVVRMLIAMGCSRLRSDVVPPEGAATDVGHHSPDQET